MAFGWKVFDASGNTILDTSDQVLTILGIFSQNVSDTLYSGSFSNSAFSLGTPFFFITKPATDDTYGGTLPCRVSFTGTTCNWSVDPSPWGTGRYGTFVFYYGYF